MPESDIPLGSHFAIEFKRMTVSDNTHEAIPGWSLDPYLRTHGTQDTDLEIGHTYVLRQQRRFIPSSTAATA